MFGAIYGYIHGNGDDRRDLWNGFTDPAYEKKSAAGAELYGSDGTWCNWHDTLERFFAKPGNFYYSWIESDKSFDSWNPWCAWVCTALWNCCDKIFVKNDKYRKIMNKV